MKPRLPQAETDCLLSLLKAAAQLGIPVVTVGATARWLVFDWPNQIEPYRTTKDWDYGPLPVARDTHARPRPFADLRAQMAQ